MAALVWTTPTIVLTHSAPEFAVSPACEQASDFFRCFAGVLFTGLHRDDATSAGTFSFRGGFVEAGSSQLLAAVQYTSSTGAYTIQGVNEEFEVTPGYALTWDALPTGWSVAPAGGPSGTTYVFRKDDRATVKTSVTATPVGTPVTSGGPGTLSPAMPIFTATPQPGQLAEGEGVLTSRNHGVLTRVQRTITHATQSSCNASLAWWAAARPLTVTPVQDSTSAGLATWGAAAPVGAIGGTAGA